MATRTRRSRGTMSGMLTPSPNPSPLPSPPPALRFKFEVSTSEAGCRVGMYTRVPGGRWEYRGKLMLKPHEWLAMALALLEGSDITGTWGDRDIAARVEIVEVDGQPIAAADWRASAATDGSGG